VVALEEGDDVARARQLLRAGHARGSGADDGHLLPRTPGRDLRLDPALAPGMVDDVLLDVLDGDRVVVDVEDAGFLAGRGTAAAGELGEVVGRVQTVDRLAPAAAVHEVVPVGDDVPERAALVAEGDATVHAARALALQHIFGRALLELAPVLEAVRDGFLVNLLALVLEEAGDFAHGYTEASLAASVSRCCFARTERYSTGITRTRCFAVSFQPERSRQATAECV